MKKQQWKAAREKIIVIGDVVYIKVQKPNNKFAPRFKGPYWVIDYDKGNKVKIRHMTTLESTIARLDHLKRSPRSLDGDEEPESHRKFSHKQTGMPMHVQIIIAKSYDPIQALKSYLRMGVQIPLIPFSSSYSFILHALPSYIYIALSMLLFLLYHS